MGKILLIINFDYNRCTLILCRQRISIKIIEESSYEKDVAFKVHIGTPQLAPGKFPTFDDER